jgi:hypothetical protein
VAKDPQDINSVYDQAAADLAALIPAPTAAPAASPASLASTGIADGAPRGSMPTADDVVKRAKQLGVDPNLALAFWSQESGRNGNSKDSPKGAVGGFQVMPDTYKGMMGSYVGQRDPWNNMEAGLRYIAYGQKTLGTTDPELLAAGYHAGYDRADLKAGKIPDTSDGMIKTADYARQVATRVGVANGRYTPITPEQAAKMGGGDQQDATAGAPTTDDTEGGRYTLLTPAMMDKLPPSAFTDIVAQQQDQAKQDAIAKESKTDSALSYLGGSLKAGAYDLAGAGARILDAINPFTLSESDAATLFKNDPQKLKDFQNNSVAMILSRFADRMSDNSDAAMQGVSAGAKARYGDKQYATLDTDKAAYLSPVKVIGDVVRNLPTQVGMALAAYFTRGAAAQAEKTALASGMTAEAARAAAVQAGARTMAAMGAGTEGAVGYAQQYNQAKGDAQKVDQATLETSPAYQALLKQGYTPETAKQQLVSDTAQQAGAAAGMADAAINQFGGEFLGKILTEGGKFIPRVLKGFANEGATEAAQSPMEQLGQNIATQKNLNPKQDVTQDLLENTIQGLVVGGVSGAATAGAGGHHHDGIQAQPAAPAAAPIDPAEAAKQAAMAKLAPFTNQPLTQPAAPAPAPVATGPTGRALQQGGGPLTTPPAPTAPAAPGAQIVTGDDGTQHALTVGPDGVSLTPLETALGENAPAAAAPEAAAAPTPGENAAPADATAEDPLYQQAMHIVQLNGRPSLNIVQRHLRIGYNRASALMDRMEKEGIVSPMAADGTRTLLKRGDDDGLGDRTPVDSGDAPLEAAQAPDAPPAPAAPQPPDLSTMDEPALRQRLKYVAQQQKLNGGSDKMIAAERRRIEQEISKRQDAAKAAPAAAPTEPAAEPAPERTASGAYLTQSDANDAVRARARETGQPHQVIERQEAGKTVFDVQPLEETNATNDAPDRGHAGKPAAGPVETAAPVAESQSGNLGAAAATDQTGAGRGTGAGQTRDAALSDAAERWQRTTTNDRKGILAAAGLHERLAGRAFDEIGGPGQKKIARAMTAQAPVAAAPLESQVQDFLDGKRDTAPELPDAHAAKWFGTPEKAQGYIEKKGIGATHEVVQTGKVRYEIKPKGQQAAETAPVVSETPAETGTEPAERIPRPGSYPTASAWWNALTPTGRRTVQRAANVSENPQHLWANMKDDMQAKLLRAGANIAEAQRSAESAAAEQKPVTVKKLGEGVHAIVIDPSATQAPRQRLMADAKVGDEFTPSGNIGYASAGQRYRVEAIGKNGDVTVKNTATGSGTTLSKAERMAAERKGVTVEKHESPATQERRIQPGEPGYTLDMARTDLEAMQTKTGEFAGVENARVSDRIARQEKLIREMEAEQAPAKQEPAPSGNKIFTDEAANEARSILRRKLGQLNSGIDPELMQAGITLAGWHIEKGARTFGAYAKAMIGDLGETVKPYLKSWYAALAFDPRAQAFHDELTPVHELQGIDVDQLTAPEATAPKETAPQEAKSLSQALYEAIKTGELPHDNNGLRKFVSDHDGVPVDNARLKVAQEALEAAMARAAHDVVAEGKDVRETFDRLRAMYDNQPNLNIRTSTSVENQAYSTPAPLAYVAAQLAQIGPQSKVYEPTAGNGMLLLTANPKNVTANELESGRVANLREQGIDALQGDALEAINSGAVPEKSQDAVIANPPFGSIKDENGAATKVRVDGYKLGKIDHLIAADALRAMKDDGHATIILGADKAPGGVSTDDRIFFNWLYSHYNVVSHFEVDGKLYGRQGANWPVRVITVAGRETSNRVSPKPGDIARVNTWEGVYDQFQQAVGAENADAERRAASGVERAVQQPTADDTRAAAQPAGEQARQVDRSQPAASPRDAGNVERAGAGAVGNSRAAQSERLGNPAGAQRGDAAPAGSNRLESRSQEGRQPAAPRAERPARDAGTDNLTPTDNAFQTAYEPASSRKDPGVLIPVNMAQPLKEAMAKLEDAVGNIDEFAAKELGYNTVDEMHDALMGLQVDSVASAIHQIKQGKGIVIADQTGIGKGRQAAAVIRWAQKNGHVPVFVTVKPSLFTDMHGDLADIGSHDIAPLIMNVDESIKGADGEKLFANKAATHKRTLENIAATGQLPEGRNALFMTYSQINVPNTQRRAVMALAPKAVFVLDESHNAGGDSATGDFIKGVLQEAPGVTYLSATYAKRPDNMPVYFKTDIGEAISDSGELTGAMAAGGLPLQTVVANNLVKAGQMFRRERSYDGVKIETNVDTARRAEHEQLSNAVTSALRAIVDADKTFHETHVKMLQQEAKRNGEAMLDIAGNQAAESVNHTEFSSVVHNFVRQLLLGLKADTAAERAIAAIKDGKKPLIAVENTMGSFLSEYADTNGLKQGDPLGAFDYRSVLTRALDRTRYVVRQLANGDKVKEYVKLDELGGTTRAKYEAAQRTIDALDLDIPVSPIDWMRKRLTEAGHSVAEITGRNLSVDYSGPQPVLSSLSAQEQKDKVATTRAFNSGKLDALILNVAGSTGISLHASERFTDQRPRHMIVAQPAQDINIFMQMLGRIHRTGQVALPSYEILNVDLPAEKRPTALLSKKMKSLNANTSSNTESATSIQAADILNKYGDQIVADYLGENPELAKALGIEAFRSDEGKALEDVARKTTGRLALMPVDVQQRFYGEVEEQYNNLIDYLNKTNQNELEPRTFDYDARELRSQTLFEGTNPESPFGQDAIYNEFSIKAQGKPMEAQEIRDEIAKHTEGMSGDEHAKAMVERMNGDLERYKSTLSLENRDAADDIARTGRNVIQSHPIGSAWRVEINGDTYNAVVTNLRSTYKGAGNPFSPSKVQVTLALNGSLRQVTVPGTQIGGIEVAPLGMNANIDGLFKARPADERETAKVVTGNLLGAYGEIQGTRGSIINFTKADGTTEQGILLPKNFNMALNTRGDYRLRTPADALHFLQKSEDPNLGRFGINSRDGNVRVLPSGRGIEIAVPKSKARGGKYFLDAKLLNETGDFVSSGQFMRATVPADKAEAAVRVLMDKTALYTLPSMADEAKTILGDKEEDGNQSVGGVAQGTGARLLRDTLTGSEVGGVVRNLMDSGKLVLHETAETVPGKTTEGVQAYTEPNGTIHMVARNLDSARAMPVLLHEMFHSGVRPLLGEANWKNLMVRLQALQRQAEMSTGRAKQFFDAAFERQRRAAAVGDTRAMSPEEFGAYAIEEYAKAPAAYKSWVDDTLGAVKGWLLRRFGIQMGQVTPAQLRALSMAALRDGGRNGGAPLTAPQQSVAPAAPAAPTAPATPGVQNANPSLLPEEQTRFQKLQAAVQDNLNRVHQVQQRIKELTGVKNLGMADYYRAETNRPGRIAARLEDVRDQMTQPLMEALAKSGHTQEQLAELLHAQHAQERNAKIAEINDAMPDGGSGMTNAEARAVLKKYQGDTALHALADQARDISKATLDLKLAYGLIDQDTHEALTKAYQYYVPLKGDGEYGPRVKRAMGHEGRNEYILENIARDYDQAVVAGEKNLARQSLLALVAQHPDPKLWSIGVPPRGRYVAGQVYNVIDPSLPHGSQTIGSFVSRSQVDAFLEGAGQKGAQYQVLDSNGDRVQEFVKPLQDNEVMVYVKGQPVRIQVQDETLARQLRPLDQRQMHPILEFMRTMNRYFSKIYTGYNPSFILRNVARDSMTGTINMLGNEGVGVAARAWTHYLSATKTLAQWAATGEVPQGKMGQYLQEYRNNGGKTGASWMSDLEQQGKTLTRMYEDTIGASGYLKQGQTAKAVWIASRKTVSGMAHVVEIANQATENALRLALYTTLRERGESAGVAAAAAKNVTVNFDRKGTLTGALGAVYLFLNPAIQGTANAMRTLAKGEHRGQALVALGMLATLGFFAGSSGMDDDKDRWLGRGWDERTKKFIYNMGGHTLTVPLSQEFAPAYALGVGMAEAMRGESGMTTATRLVSSFLDAYFPLNNTYNPDSNNHLQDAFLSATPTLLKPIGETAANRDHSGHPIVPESDATKDRPDNLKMYRTTKGTVFDALAQGIASGGEMLGNATGGVVGGRRYENDLTKVSPETLKYLWRTYAGGLGQFVADSAGVASLATEPGALTTDDVPILKDFVRSNDVKPIRGRFYDIANEAKAAATEFAQAKKAGDGEGMDQFLNAPNQADLLALNKLFIKSSKAVAQIRDEEVNVNADKTLNTAQKREQLKALEGEEESIYRSALDAFQPRPVK